MFNRSIIVFLCFTVSATALAQSATLQYFSKNQGFSFDELVQLALSRNKDLIAARESLRQAEARLTQARLRPNPSVDVFRMTDRLFANEGDTGFSMTFSQPFELGGKRAKRVQVEETSIDLAKAEIADAERQFLGRLRSLHVQAIRSASRLDLFQRLDHQNQQMVSLMDVRLRAGDASRLDSRLLAAQTNQVSAQRVVAEAQVAGTILQIRTLVGLSPNDVLLLKRTEQPAQFHETEENIMSRALGSRPDLKAAKLREKLAIAGITLAKSQAVPNVTGFARYGRESIPILSVGGSGHSFERENVLEFGVSFPLPLFNREQGNIAQAASQRVQARAARESLELTIRQEVLLAFQRCQTAQRALEILQTGVVQPNQEGLQIVRLAYNLGEMRLLDIVNQQRVVIEAETSYVDAQTELNSALAELELAVGAAIP